MRVLVTGSSGHLREALMRVLALDGWGVAGLDILDSPCEALYERRGWRLSPSIERAYVNQRARRDLGWSPRYGFRHALERLDAGEEPRSPLALAVGSKGYHAVPTWPYTTR